MEPFTMSFISSLVANLTTNVLNAAGRKFRISIQGTEKEKAIKRCLNTAIIALLTSSTTHVKEELDLLENIFRQFFADEDVAKEVAVLLRGQPLNREELTYLFEQIGFEAKTLKGLELETAISTFEGAFITAAVDEPSLQTTIQTKQLLLQTRLQQELLRTVRDLVKFLRQVHAETVSIQNGQIKAIEKSSRKILKYKLVDAKVDIIRDRAFKVNGDVTESVIITGDKSQVIFGQKDTASVGALRTAYLNHIFNATHYLSLAGIDPKAASDAEARLQLDAVYTALLTLSTEAHEQWQRGKLQDKESPRLSALEQLNRHPHLVLLGDPGSGKSTFVNFVALCMAGEALERKDANLSLLTTPIPEENKEKEKSQPWYHQTLIPIRVILRDFAARGLPKTDVKVTAQHLWTFISEELKSATLSDYADHLQKELQEKGGLLLIDGLDEVPEADRRRTQIKQAVEDFAAAYPRCRILVTSRTYAYQQQAWRLPDFTETVLAPFSKSQIRFFVDRWYAHIGVLRGLHADDAQGRAELLKRAIFGSDRLESLAERPLLLTLMASLHAWRGGSLPEKREELYADAVDLLLDWWESPKTVRDADSQVKVVQPSLAEWLKVDRQKVRDLLNELAYKAHESQPELTGTADVPEQALISGLLHLSQNPDVKPARLLEYLSQRAGLLLPRGVGIYTFPHRTFQEYLAACYLTDHDYPDKLAELVCADPNRWREVALLAGAKAARGAASTIWLFVDTLCYREPEAEISCLSNIWCAHLAGQALVETADLSRVSERNQEKIDRVKSWLVTILRKEDFPAIERALAGNNLARLGDPRAEAMNVADMQFCLVPAGNFWMGSPEEDKMAYVYEKPMHEQDIAHDYWISRYPITNAQFQSFVDARDGYCNDDWWTADGLKWRRDRKEPDKAGAVFDLPDHPVVMVRWYEAVAFTNWLTFVWQRDKILSRNWIVRLPAEAEWEKAARGGNMIVKNPVILSIGRINFQSEFESHKNVHSKRRYPWGDDPDPNRANYSDTGIGSTSAIGCFPNGIASYGCEEMSGNVWEWTRSLWGNKWIEPVYKYPYHSNDGRENLNAPNDIARVVRGGSFGRDRGGVRCAGRSGGDPGGRNGNLGFRVVLSPF